MEGAWSILLNSKQNSTHTHGTENRDSMLAKLMTSQKVASYILLIFKNKL